MGANIYILDVFDLVELVLCHHPPGPSFMSHKSLPRRFHGEVQPLSVTHFASLRSGL